MCRFQQENQGFRGSEGQVGISTSTPRGSNKRKTAHSKKLAREEWSTPKTDIKGFLREPLQQFYGSMDWIFDISRNDQLNLVRTIYERFGLYESDEAIRKERDRALKRLKEQVKQDIKDSEPDLDLN